VDISACRRCGCRCYSLRRVVVVVFVVVVAAAAADDDDDDGCDLMLLSQSYVAPIAYSVPADLSLVESVSLALAVSYSSVYTQQFRLL